MSERDWREQLLTREDIGYGPARAYEPGPGRAGSVPRERRLDRRRREAGVARARQGGPYLDRLHRRRRPDSWIKADVEETLFFDTWIAADRIVVDVTEGVATLLGTLPSRDEIRRAIEDAARVPGVSRVRSRLETPT